MWMLLGSVFVASLLGSLHCVGMCGPFAMIAGGKGERKNSAMSGTFAYSCGRLITYAIVGAIFGTLGLALNQGVSFSSWQQTATYVAGGLMIVVGVIALARQLGWKINMPGFGTGIQRLLKRFFDKAIDRPPIQKAFMIGALSSLMPCGWLYTFAIVAAGTGSPITGSLVMIVFWAGTVPIMVGVVFGVARLSVAIQRKIPAAMAAMVILIGVFTIAFRAPIAIGDESVVIQEPMSLIDQVNNIDQEQLPCCSDEN